mmetsp:Transcript_26538/g.61755  ORF Transcript_26538/g.61755 Transcript_26538/m.61755 type:complete len:207 (-) Transcript_26538:34-654(-)
MVPHRIEAAGLPTSSPTGSLETARIPSSGSAESTRASSEGSEHAWPRKLEAAKERRGSQQSRSEQIRQSRLAEFLRKHGFEDARAPPPKRQYWINFEERLGPLHVAAQNGEVELVRLLLAAGANPEQKTSWGRSVRACTSRLGKGAQQAIADLLNSNEQPMKLRDALAKMRADSEASTHCSASSHGEGPRSSALDSGDMTIHTVSL